MEKNYNTENTKDSEMEPTNQVPIKKSNKRFNWVLIGIIVLVLLVTVPTKSITCYRDKIISVQEPRIIEDCNWEDVLNPIKDCNWEDIPYPGTEFETSDLDYKSIPYIYPTSVCIEKDICEEWSQICVEKNFWGNCIEWEDECNYWGCSKERKTCKYYIKNLDDYYGTWKIESTIKNKDTGTSEYLGQKSASLYEMDETTLRWDFITSRLDDTYSCEYKITKIPIAIESKDVIKFKPELVCEDVITIIPEWICKNITVMEDVEKTIQESYDKRENWLYGECDV